VNKFSANLSNLQQLFMWYGC